MASDDGGDDGQNRRTRRKAAPSYSLSENDGVIDMASSNDSDSEEEELPVRSKTNRRVSSRSTKFSSSLAEPMDSLARPPRPMNASPVKSPARRHVQRRRSLPPTEPHSDDGNESSDEQASNASSEEDDEDDEPLKIQRILASRSEPRGRWNEICRNINTSEIDYGSRWFQSSEGKDDDIYEERFLVKWADLSYLHVSWETQADMVDQVEGAKTYLTTFFRKSHHGLLFTADERNDGDYFDPAFTEIDRILGVSPPDKFEHELMTLEKEDEYDANSFGMVFDKSDPSFENGTGRQFLIKWKNMPYTDATYEFERDLILCEVEYKDHVKAFLRRSHKPSRKEMELVLREGQLERRRLENDVFGIEDEEERAAEIEKYQKELQSVVYKNGGQLRDYQAEGIAWMLVNYLDHRCSILADEMGLGKTLQTAAFVNILKTKLCVIGPVLVVVPLSTISHWYREFQSWTDLNTIIYHGSATDRDLIRQFEMAYDSDRPQAGVAFNQLFLRKCGPRKPNKVESPWMVDVVITTPEMIVADDYAELTAIEWELVVVDEAHRLKNRSSKLAVNLRDERFEFASKLLLTGTPIQNSVEEFWSLLSILDSDAFDDQDAFMKAYGDMKSKDSVDALHETIRPYILRRLKEDVEKSVPQKSETLIEVELTLDQKQWYRALFEKNLKFLHKNKKKALDGPGLNNLAMELRKCCNHLFLLNGVEEEFRRENRELSEVEYLVKASGKLVLLDKLLPRLKEEGHRVLIFSQFKIMLDILEDYLNVRSMKYERIDGSITGNRRQQAIDRFQAAPSDGKELPFIMMLSTRAGGVGINLTAADTVIIFDSDFNPQNDLQAQARCHRIGQTKAVKVYRLLTRKTYEMQMFHMSSLKMGLDQVVLKGFESNSTGEGSLSKEEVERLLRHGAYDIFNEEKAGTAEAESNDFIQSDIDAILDSRSRTVVHENTGSQSNAAGGTFSKARFTVTAKSPDPNKQNNEDIDIEDPDFWAKMIGESSNTDMDVDLGPRQRTKSNYSDAAYQKSLELSLGINESDGDGESDTELENSGVEGERLKWGGTESNQWSKDDADLLVRALSSYGYNLRDWAAFECLLNLSKEYDSTELKRMSWSLVLTSLIEAAQEEAQVAKKKDERILKQKAVETHEEDRQNGGVLASKANLLEEESSNVSDEELEKAFKYLWKSVSSWAGQAVRDAVDYASTSTPRDSKTLSRILRKPPPSELTINDIHSKFARSVWPSLKTRGWTANVETEGSSAGQTRYVYSGTVFTSVEDVLQSAKSIHPELLSMVNTHIDLLESSKAESKRSSDQARSEHLLLSEDTVSVASISAFLEHYAPVQLVYNRTEPSKSVKKLRLGKRLLASCTLLHDAWKVVSQSISESGNVDFNRLQKIVVIDKKSWLPHPQWNSHHDAVLLYAIWKHGWIEHESCCRAISNDPSIRWGSPFNAEESKTPTSDQKQSESYRFIEVAKRAALFLTNEAEGLHSGELKGFNANLVARTYGLIKPKDDGASDSWIVDFSQFEPENGPVTELPTRKDLMKRAKLVLSRIAVVPIKNESNVGKVNHSFVVLDQSDRCNVFLAEVLRCLVKMPATNVAIRRLGEIAFAEAKFAFEIQSKERGGDASSDSRKIMNQIDLVKRSLSRGANQAKNVCRVMLGEEPVKPKKATDPIFPSLKVSELTFVTKNGSKVSRPGSALANSSAGETALLKARKLCKDSNSLTGLPGTSNNFLRLTETETLILSILCVHGIPDFINSSTKSEVLPNEQGWENLGSILMKTSRDLLNELKRKIREAKEQAKDISELLRIESDFLEMEAVASQAQEYAAEPDTFAKKVMMLVVKLRQLIVSSFTNHSHPHSFIGLGPKIPMWFDKETIKWGTFLDLLDDAGRPLGFSAVDFLLDVPEQERRKIRISSMLDRKGCETIYCQISSITRIRSLVGRYEDMDLTRRLNEAAIKVLANGDKFIDKPNWWLGINDAVLLKQIPTIGLSEGLLELFFENEESIESSSLSKSVLQRRANQLARELHVLDATKQSFERLEQVQLQRQSEAESNTKQGSQTHQTGLLTFLKPKPAPSEQTIIDLSRNDSSEDLKRKPSTDGTYSSPEKKFRHT
ncbi:chromodomain-helicase-DNA-binding protein 7 [Fistulifera solaris]|uniref:Chromodomain-helicase-DNA-binding protein 7 n=1 Tax=Fistulifera solaris TaxID=1519565 RepID=A0A1Z5KJW4_FISSO|nr:chromodomain-helicase-DNA-binding protein 7 [Fistulifera solaris]|eukprot:GAX26228.1 chromodomain-helicase-DNA-binding protein 7 [Fistulifera solaris]